MREVTREIVRAFINGQRKTIKNTRTDGSAIYLHGNKIAWRDGDAIYASMCGWNTTTTRDRLNGLCDELNIGKRFCQKKHEPFFGEMEISSSETIRLK